MSRRPLALFGAIVAVGLGPALWLGVQFGSVDVAPQRPPVIREQEAGGQELLGGAGAGAAPAVDSESLIRTTPRSGARPVTASPSPSPTRSPSPPDPRPSSSPSESPRPTDEVSTSPTAEPTEPPVPGDDETDDPTIAPEPPPVGSSPGENPSSPVDNGGIGAGAGESEEAEVPAGQLSGR